MKIEFTQGALAGAEFPLDRPSVTIGRGADVDLQILDSSVSRRHAQLRMAGGLVSVADLGSHNGTFVNGIRIHHAQELEPGDEITLGASVFRLVPGEARSAWPPPDEMPMDWAPPEPNRARRSPFLLVAALGALFLLGGIGALVLLVRQAASTPAPTLAALSGAAPTLETATLTASPQPPTATSLPTATTEAATVTPTTGAVATAFASIPPAATSTHVVVVALTATQPALVIATSTPRPTATVAPTSTEAPSPTARPTEFLPSYTVSWSPGTYDPWEGGHRLRTDLTITNVSLPEIAPPYEPAFIIVGSDGSLRSGDIYDYSSPTNPLPALQPGQSVTWTWYTIMPVQDWVRGSAFRYGELTWTQEFSQDGSLSGAARATSDSVFAPLIPTVFPTGLSPENLATALPTIMPTILPTFLPSGVSTDDE